MTLIGSEAEPAKAGSRKLTVAVRPADNLHTGDATRNIGIRRSVAGLLVHCRLCWRITAMVFGSILLVEALILIPSYRNYERDRLTAAFDAAAAAVEAGYVAAGRPPLDAPAAMAFARAVLGTAELAGIAVEDADGRPLLRVGRQPQPGPHASVGPVEIQQTARISAVASRPFGDGGESLLVLDIDTPNLVSELRGFLWRIGGLIALISLVVTIVTMLVLRGLVLDRLVRLAHNIEVAARKPEKADESQTPPGRRDELGDLASNVNSLLISVSVALAAVREREEKLVLLNRTLEQRVDERTAELSEATVAAEAASTAKSVFLTNMSHELRTPLNAIIGFAQILAADDLRVRDDRRDRGYATDILHSGEHLLSLVNDILDISRIEADRFDLNEEEVGLASIIEEAVRLVRHRAEQKGLTLDIVPFEGDDVVVADRRLMKQSVLNLMANAVNFTPQGGRIHVEVRESSVGSIGIGVTDTGIGIAEDKIETVFQPFGQVSDVMTRDHQGTGLGLPLTRRFMELHDGALDLVSTVGAGTCVTAWLPPGRRVGYRREALASG